MIKPMLYRRLAQQPAVLLLAAAACIAQAQAQAQPQVQSQVQPQVQPPTTLELTGNQGQLTAGLPKARAVNLRGTWLLGGGRVAGVEVLDESKFGARGGVVAGSYTHVLNDDWYATGTAAWGRGGPNWANQRLDLDVATKWGAARDIVSHVALYGARFDAGRSDRGLRLSLVAYLPASTVIEGGVILNVSEPGSVRSQMPYASLTWGREGEQFVVLRLSSGTEAYQALGTAQQLVNFRSSSVGLTWRRWLGQQWGFIASAEGYRNPSYERRTLGAGLLVQF
jgi:YaiO family outer membrane protein